MTHGRGAGERGRRQPGRALSTRRAGAGGRPAAPHHTASAVALVGGGSPPRPGEISLAHHGVLFLDELPEFPRAALEALREPLETGRITISRAARQAEFPARFQLIAAMNPCPCGYLGHPRCKRLSLHAGPGGALPGQAQRPAARPHRPAGRSAGRAPRAAARARPTANPPPPSVRACVAARDAAVPAPGQANQALQGAGDRPPCRLDEAALKFLHTRRAPGLVGPQHAPRPEGRPHHCRSGRCATPCSAHVAEAMQYRRALQAPA